ncbi:MAG: glycoside hydrolase [Kangiella sp.]|nr:MAG: glycoside hydrolase [Kangiella sp.]
MTYKTSKKLFLKRCATFVPIICILMVGYSVSREAIADGYFSSELKDVTHEMLSSTHWQSTSSENRIFYSTKEILNQNAQLFKQNPHMNRLVEFPNSLSFEEIRVSINKASKQPSSHRYNASGKLINNQQWLNYKNTLNLFSLQRNSQKEKRIQFGLVVKRTALRSFPTNDAVFKKPNEINLDRFQETALFPAEAVAILHHSLDSNWLFVSNYNYSGWVKKEDIATANRLDVFNFSKDKHFLTITGDKVFTNYNPHDLNVSQIQLDMGVTLPLVNKSDIPATLGDQNTFTSYVVNLPTRTTSGALKIKMALIPRNKDVQIGYLPFTEKNIIDQSFKFLGERYGWGHSFNARDCTGFVGDIYKSFGILMPRNSGQQAQSEQGQNIRFSKSASKDEKLKEIRKLNPGDLIYIPGHVMIFLGLQNNNPYIIHDVSGLSYYNRDGNYINSKLNGVSVTPLLPLQINAEKSYLDDVYSLKKLR